MPNHLHGRRKNPNTQEDFEHLPPEHLVIDILDKYKRVAEIMAEIKAILEQQSC
ncbi:hypothetical protein H6G93_23695 [Nostoc sp. FACHB-973]|nr:hypothetical protein [Nostoc sp. FACHB-973]